MLTEGTPRSEVAVKVSVLSPPDNRSVDMPARIRVGGAWLQGALTCRAFHRHRP
jgi:hypothetical protein